MKPTIVTALLAVVATVACATGAEAGVLTAMNLREPPGRLAASLDGAHTCFVPSDGTVRCWGRNEFGQIGNGGGPGDQPVPAMVSGIATAVAVTVGRDHTCALHASGVVQCWGSNASGQLGVGVGTTSSNTPLTVPGVTGATSISAGALHTCARLSTGRVQCWGSNASGQIGDQSGTGTRFSPVFVSNIFNAIAVTAGLNHTCALRVSGAVICWGRNNDGQLGIGSTVTRRFFPTEEVVGLTAVAGVLAGNRFTCARRAGGEVFCWGANDLGQLGADSSAASSTTPLRVRFESQGRRPDLGDIVELVVGASHACAVTGARHFPICWGQNASGQLGTGATGPPPPSLRELAIRLGRVGATPRARAPIRAR